MKSDRRRTDAARMEFGFAAWLSPSLLAAVTALAVTVGGQSGAVANLLANPNLDQTAISTQNGATPVGWVVEATKTISGAFFDGASSEPWCNVQETDGFGLFFKPFQGDAAAGDLLTVRLYQDNPASPGEKFTLSGYAAGEANYSGFFTTNSPPPATLFVVEFLDSTGGVLASNTLDLVAAGLPNSGPASMAQLIMPEVTAPAGTATVRAGASIINTYSTSGSQSFFVDAFELTSVAPPGAPVITNQPVDVSVSPGGAAVFTVGVSNTAGVSYQWQLQNTNLANGGQISGANTATLTINNASLADIGVYRVVVSNSDGSATSTEVKLALVGINFFPVVLISGKIGDTYRVDYATSLAPTTWLPLSTNVLQHTPEMIVDTTSPGANNRFYRAVLVR